MRFANGSRTRSDRPRVWKTLPTSTTKRCSTSPQSFREGVPFATPVFDGAREGDIRHLLKFTELPETRQDHAVMTA